MVRFLGMMPARCVEISKTFVDQNNMLVTIEAGKVGWTIVWADYSTESRDKVDTPENNFQEAYDVACEALGPLKLREE